MSIVLGASVVINVTWQRESPTDEENATMRVVVLTVRGSMSVTRRLLLARRNGDRRTRHGRRRDLCWAGSQWVWGCAPNLGYTPTPRYKTGLSVVSCGGGSGRPPQVHVPPRRGGWGGVVVVDRSRASAGRLLARRASVRRQGGGQRRAGRRGASCAVPASAPCPRSSRSTLASLEPSVVSHIASMRAWPMSDTSR